MDDSSEKLIQSALEGDTKALEQLIVTIKNRIYNLALRMVWDPHDAEDATQEILIKIVTKLSTFKGKSHFSTWAFRIASNHLLTMKKRKAEMEEVSFEIFENVLHDGFNSKTGLQVAEVERDILEEETKIGCTHAMLLCLDRSHRLVFILDALFNIKSKEGASILDITPEAFRKRLSRSKNRMRTFLEKNCGLVSDTSPCNCSSRIETAIQNKRIDPENLLFNGPSAEKSISHDIERAIEEMEELDMTAAVFFSNPYYEAPANIINAVKKIVNSDTYTILSD